MIKGVAFIVIGLTLAWVVLTLVRRPLEGSDLRSVGARHDLRAVDPGGWSATRDLRDGSPRRRLRPAVGGRTGDVEVLVLRWAYGRDGGKDSPNRRREGVTVAVRGPDRLTSLLLAPRATAPVRRLAARVGRREVRLGDVVEEVEPDEGVPADGRTGAVLADPVFAALVIDHPGVRVRSRDRELWVEVVGRTVPSRVVDDLVPLALDLRRAAAGAVARR